jgi:hypothetical protein
MELNPGKCLKCGTEILHNGRPSSLWRQKGFNQSDGMIMFIAICRNCVIVPDEYGAASRALNLASPIVGEAERSPGIPLEDTIVEIAKEAQGGKCHFCGKPIGENYVISGGYICCERC